MNLLRASELIYGRLLKVEQPHLIERYNKALAAFGLKPTKLESFEIDRTGFSPQVADELGDPHYLDPNEVNRRFIILTPAQADLPVVHTAISNTSQQVHEFFAKNNRAIDALTIKDVIYGEIEDSVASVENIESWGGTVQFAASSEQGDQMRDRRAVEPLVSSLKDAAADVREQAAFALGQLRDRAADELYGLRVRDQCRYR